MFRKILLLLALCAMLFQQQVAQAQALPILSEAFSGTVNEVIASAVESNLARRGIVVAANDASMLATESYIGTAANAASYASTALTTVAAIAGAPVWLTVALGVGALAAVGGVAWGIYQLTQNNGLGSTTPDGSPMPVSLSLAPIGGVAPPAAPASSGVWTTFILPGCTGLSVCATGVLIPSNVPYYVSAYNGAAGTYIGCSTANDCAQQVGASQTAYYCQPGGNSACSATWTTSIFVPQSTLVVTWDASTCVLDCSMTSVSTNVSPSPNPNYVTQVSGNLTAIEPRITSSMLTQPVPQQLLANMVNQLWQDAAAKPGYTGQPYSSVNPVTSSDVASAPETATWNDLLTTPAPIGSTVVPISPTASSSTGTGGTDPASGTTSSSEDMCEANPNASACAPLGTAPVAPAIPSSSTSVGMSPVSVGPSDGVCPAPIAVNVFGSTFSIDYSPLCSFVTMLRPLVLAMCALGAALIVVLGVG